LARAASTRAPSTQRKLILPGETTTLVLSTVETARAQLPGHDEDDILAMIEDGQLEYAWNIGLGASRTIRIYPACIDHYLRTGGTRPFRGTCSDHIRRSLGGKPFTTGTRLALLLNCGGTHVINLVEADALCLQPGTAWSPGPHGSPLITMQSIEQFFAQRRIL